MKKLLLGICVAISVSTQAQQNVGIGTNTPETKLQVNGAISLVPSEADAAPTVAIPDNVSAFRLKLIAGGSNTALTLNNGKEGQILTIYNEDDNTASFAGVPIIATTGSASFMYINGAWRITASNSVSGPQGPQGPAGPAGAVGPQGAQGNAGPAGAAGAVGAQGPAGPQGNVGAVGPQGPQGTAGAVGAQGPVGPVGPVGAVGPQGPQGNVGPAGAAGAVGPQGPQGTAGAVGAQGPQGNVGAVGPQGPQGNAGAVGAQGPQGNVGPAGAVGPQGPQGTAGAVGAQGAVGPAGSVGPQGAQGNAGPQGPAGTLAAGTAAGNTTYWNGSTWVLNSNNIFNNGGNVGIGSNNPSNKLTIDGTAPVTEIRSGGYLMMRPTANGWDMRLNAVSQRLDVLSGGDLVNPIATFVNGGNVGVGEVNPASKLHVMGKINLHQSGGGGGQNRFEGLDGNTTANGRAQFVMSSAYSDLVIASSQTNDLHGSTLSFVTYNPANANDYRKFVVGQGNWGARRGFLDFGYSDANGRSNPHININATDQVMSLDGFNKRVGIGGTMSPSFTLDVNGKSRIRRGGYTMGNANEGQLELGNAGNGDCFISFHREGAYGAQFGLASDNWFSTYGWSAGGGYTPIRLGTTQVNGNLSVTGSATFGSIAVPWSSVTSKPAAWLDNPILIAYNSNFNSSVPSGFYEASDAANAPGSSWYNMLNVRHSNSGNDHGFQMSMSYYDEYCYTRTYQGGNGSGGGTFTPWARHITNRPGDWSIASNDAGTGYTAGTLELREYNYAGAGATPPHLGFHWSGVVASNITIEADGTIAIRNNPGNGYEKFRCATVRTSGITETSDARLKKNVTPITNAMDAVLQLRGVNYKWKTNEELKNENISYQANDEVNPNGEMGFIAQEVEKILPQLVNTDAEGFKSMEYSKMVALLVEAYKDLHNQHEQLQGQYSNQQQQIDKITVQMQTLMQQLPANGTATVNSSVTK